ncbi:MAG: OmpA family protein [Methylocystaceae bacterium]|nr:OmpA family protein [Methylocystaceae bacterium]
MSKLVGFRKVLLGSVCAFGMLASTQASAQVASAYNNNVMVDLSVLDDNGLGTAPSIANPMSQAKMPPVKMPKSTFYGLPDNAAPAAAQRLNMPMMPNPNDKPQSRIVLQKPMMNAPKAPSLPKTKLAESNTIKLTKPSAPTPAPVIKMNEVAKSAPKPIEKPAPKTIEVVIPKQVEETKKVVEQVKAEPPKPVAAPSKPVEVAKKEITPPPAPKPKELVKEITEPVKQAVTADAPPPPPAIEEPKEVVSAISKEVEKQKQAVTASLPPQDEASVRISFQSGQSKMPSSAETNLKKLADTLRSQPDDRVQLLAYAGGESLTASKARRLSLSRALAVRSYLIGEGVKSTRIDVRALGNKTTEEPFDRVDVQITPR